MFGRNRQPRAPRQPVNLERVDRWLVTLRDLLALLFIPALCVYATGLVLILWLAFGKHEDSAVVLRVVDALAWALIGLLALIGLGTLWLQRREIPNIQITGPAGLNVNIGEGGDNTPSASGGEGDVARK